MDPSLLHGLTTSQLEDLRTSLIEELMSPRHSWSDGGTHFTARNPKDLREMLEAVQQRLTELGADGAPPRRRRVGQAVFW